MITYLVTYNTPKQLNASLFLNKQLYQALDALYIIDNSDVPELIDKNNAVVQDFDDRFNNITVIHQGKNLGIGPARRLASDHFLGSTKAKYMMYLEDDFIQTEEGHQDSCGFRHNVSKHDLVRFATGVMDKLELDFFKLCFQEVFGNNTQNWAYRNMNEAQKRKYKVNSPDFTPFENIHVVQGTPVITGGIYYCNWPQITSRDFAQHFMLQSEHFYEQHLMATYSLLKHPLKSALLLGSAFKHDRLESYDMKDRKET